MPFYNNSIWFWYDLISTNSHWRCFQQNYRGVVFCAEIKVLQMQQNFLTIFFGTKEALEASWEGQKSHEVATTHQGKPAPFGAPWCLLGPSWLIFTWNRCPKILYIQKHPEITLDQKFLHRKPLYPWNTNLDPVPAPCRRGKSSP